jgi:hypothetical protein
MNSCHIVGIQSASRVEKASIRETGNLDKHNFALLAQRHIVACVVESWYQMFTSDARDAISGCTQTVQAYAQIVEMCSAPIIGKSVMSAVFPCARVVLRITMTLTKKAEHIVQRVFTRSSREKTQSAGRWFYRPAFYR